MFTSKNKIAKPDGGKKEELKFKILNESRNYYENNLNIFSNGLSLMSVNSLEMHQIAHQCNAQANQRRDLTEEMVDDTKDMKKTTSKWIKKLKEKIENMK